MRLVWLLFAVLALALVLHPLFGPRAFGQELRAWPVFNAKRCLEVSYWVEGVAEIRDTAAQEDKHLALLKRRNLEQSTGMVALLMREAARVYAAPDKKPKELGADFFERCMLGILGRDS